MDIMTNIKTLFSESYNTNEKVCIPIKNYNDNYSISDDLNSASHYYIVDFKQKTSSLLGIDDIQEIFCKNNGRGFQALEISSIICEGVAPMALKILTDAKITVWKPIGINIVKNIKLFQDNQLSSFINTSNSKSCTAYSCSSCTSVCN